MWVFTVELDCTLLLPVVVDGAFVVFGGRVVTGGEGSSVVSEYSARKPRPYRYEE